MSGRFPRLYRGGQIARAFLDMGYSTAISYPVNFAMSAIQPLVPVVSFYFVAQLVVDGPSVGGDYYSFVIIGILVTQFFGAALGGFTSELQSAVQQGRFEMLLVEPVRWAVLPFGLAQWPIVSRLMYGSSAGLLSVALGARFSLEGLPLSIAILALGLASSLSIGIMAGAVGAISKRSNPVLTLYTLFAGLLSGVVFPIELLPTPVRALSWLIPHTYAITGIRHVLLPQGPSVPGPTPEQALLALSVFVVISYPLVYRFYLAMMEAGRRTGVLSGY